MHKTHIKLSYKMFDKKFNSPNYEQIGNKQTVEMDNYVNYVNYGFDGKTIQLEIQSSIKSECV